MKSRLFLPFALLLYRLISPVPVHADEAKPADMTAEDRIELTRIEDYLNGLSTAKAAFSQAGANGGVSTGTFYLSRPGRLRFDYAQPQKDVILADGKFVWYYDARLKDANHAPISRTLADFLLRPRIELIGGDIVVTEFQRLNDAVVVTMTQGKDPAAGSLTVTFAERPLQISQWRVVDSQGRTTRVVLDHPQFSVALDPGLFVWHDPEDQ